MTAAADRRYDLDWLRILAFAVLILFHVGLFYAGWDWHVKSPRASGALDATLLLTSPWRLGLLFFVSGCACRFMLDRSDPWTFAWDRTWRLLPPLIFAAFLIMPPQSYFELIQDGQVVAPGLIDYGWRWLAGLFGLPCDGPCLPVPTWNNMWFVAYVLAYALALAALVRARGPLTGLSERIERLSPVMLLILPWLTLSLFRLALFPWAHRPHVLLADWYEHAVWFSLFVGGYLIAKSEVVAERLAHLRWIALSLAVAAYLLNLFYIWAWHGRGEPSPLWAYFGMRFVFAAEQWFWVAAALGFARRYLSFDHPIRRYMTVAIFPFYIVHQTIIIMVAPSLAGLWLPLWLEAALLIAATFGGSWIIYEIVRRISWLRRVFGLKSQPTLRSAKRPPAAA
ncbi:acyltransferase family protein [Brevundimonas sp. 2R-24]|uniref:Acyltransferase family protein n=1 Tax=Peiella sedimenti TaxID=3061083 RepID=A0ABT8SJ35_9CAUL|nr:acyltransferase family protein [Caulobacteraceae bacterium XZ-24]